MRTNCNNCGAILKSGKCEYCGTNYGMPDDMRLTAAQAKVWMDGFTGEICSSPNPSDIIVCFDPRDNVIRLDDTHYIMGYGGE